MTGGRLRAVELALVLTVAGLGCLWPLRDAILSGGLPGAGPDVVSTTWGAWWLSQVGPTGLFGTWTDLANHPHGASGTILSPLTTGLQALTMPLVGAGRSVALTGALHALALAAATGWLARTAGVAGPAAWVAGVSVLVGRYLPFGLGEGSIVAVAALPIPLGLVALVRLRQGAGWVAVAAAAACAGWAALENPYLAPILPAVALVLAASQARASEGRRLAAALVGGTLAVLAVVALFKGGASSDYPREIAGTSLTLGSFSFTVVDLPWSRVRPWELVWGGDVRWTLTSDAGVSAGGGRTFGLTVLALAVVGGWRRSRQALPWLALAIGMLVLAAGSVQADIGLPFLYLNTALDAFARPLTQPVRFLAVALIAVAVAAGHGASTLSTRPWAMIVVLVAFIAESAFLGAGSLRLPSTPLPQADCLAGLHGDLARPPIDDGAVLTWPWDATDDEPSRSQLLQLQHGRAGVHRGIASWDLDGRTVQEELRGAGFREPGRGPPRLEALPLRMLGFRWVVAEPAADPAGTAWLRSELGAPVLQCGDVVVFSLGR